MPPLTYCHHRILCAPLTWQTTAATMRNEGAAAIAADGGHLFGIWRSQIGRPRDELNAITVWMDDNAVTPQATAGLVADLDTVGNHAVATMHATLRPEPSAPPNLPDPPTKQGNYAFRWFETPAVHWNTFLELCAGAWPGFEAAYDSQVIGLWRFQASNPSGDIKSLMLTRRPNLAMWERSKLPANAAEAEVRRKLSRRYDLCTATWVETATSLTATDHQDTARWT